MEEKAEEVPKNRLVRAQEYGQRFGQRVFYAVDHLLSVISTHARARVERVNPCFQRIVQSTEI
jgi:hypothetical protein